MATTIPGDPMDRTLAAQLQERDTARRLDLARRVALDLGNRFDAGICAVLVDALVAITGPALDEWLDGLEETPNALWLQAHLLTATAGQARAWERFVSLRVRHERLDLVAWARALAGAGAHEDAARALRLGFAPGAAYSVFARAEKLVKQVAGLVRSNLRQTRIAVLGSTTTTLFTPVLEALCLRDRIGAEFYQAPFDSVHQEIWSSESGLARFRPAIVLSLQHWRDLHLEAVTAEESAFIKNFVEQHKQDWKRLSDSFACHIIQTSFDYPACDAFGNLSATLRGGRTRVIDLINLHLREQAPPNVSILNLAAVEREVGAGLWESEAAWRRYRQHPSLEALPELAENCMAHVRAVLGLSRKALVVDLDNTMWGGVIGEDGLDGIALGPDSPEGEAFLSLQSYMLDLKRRGILLAVCSKNNLADAQAPFERHPHSALKLDDFAAFVANWEDKASNLRLIARQLNLGLDSFVFLDDNPLEREWVRSQIPEVTVIEPGTSPFHFVRELDRGRYFEALSLSREDLARADQYRVEAQREGLRASAASVEEFLANLRLQAQASSIHDRNLARVTQLVNKTNQFNVTTRRYTEDQVRAIAQEPNGWAAAFEMSDRMGSYGLIGVLFCRPAEGAAWEVDTWLMSCRTLGRQMEKFMFDRLIESAIEKGIRRIIGVYRPTAKNEMVRALYDQMGFRRMEESSRKADCDDVRYELDVPAKAILTATHVRRS